MTLRDHIAARIRADGPMSVADFMTECLLHPTMGYYTTKTPFGVKGDFITAPEISQMFGELVGLCLAQSWMDQGQPAPFTLAELGPGRGTLMADILRATRSVPGFSQAAQVSLVEVSPKMREMQTKTLDGVSVTFHDRTGDLPDQPLFLVANEFFDALPIRQFVRAQNQWNERRIGLSNDDLAFGLAPELPQTFLDHRLADTRPGQVVEVCAGAAEVIGPVGARINRHGGAALIIDYGDWRSLGDTLQALRAHQPVDVLADPGHADLTAHVDFEALALACPCPVSRLTPQGVFLERLGLTARAQALAASLSEAALERHIAAHRRLTHPKEMGNLFKVLGVFPSDKAPPPGLQI